MARYVDGREPTRRRDVVACLRRRGGVVRVRPGHRRFPAPSVGAAAMVDARRAEPAGEPGGRRMLPRACRVPVAGRRRPARAFYGVGKLRSFLTDRLAART